MRDLPAWFASRVPQIAQVRHEVMEDRQRSASKGAGR